MTRLLLFFLGSGFDSSGGIQEYVVNLCSTGIRDIPSGLWHLVFSSFSKAVASFHLFVILHEFYNGNWNKGVLGPAGLPRY